MEKEKLISEIDRTLESIKTHISRIKNDPDKVHKMDMDLLIEKTRDIYDKLIQLDGLTITFETEIPPFETEILHQNQNEKEIEETETVETVDIKVEEIEKEEAKAEEEAEITEEDIKVEVHVEEIVDEVEEQIEEAQEKKELREDFLEEKEETEKSTIDLFTSSAGPTLSDTFSEGEQPTIADKINKEGVNELREAIGINEKFLFINELFNGDLGRYNKVIDELDELTTIEGVNTYVLELKIQSQWADDNIALIKLTDLLNRKFVK